MPWPTILWVILVDWVMIVTGLVGALVSSSYKWGFFAFGTAAMFYIFYELGFQARKHANHLGKDIGSVFLYGGVLTLVVWLCYPIAWGVSEGGNIIAPDSEAVFYGILDLLAKPVFGAILLWGHRNIDPARLGMRIRDYDEPIHHGGLGGLFGEKHGPGANGHSNGVSNGATNGHTTTGHAPAEVPTATSANTTAVV